MTTENSKPPAKPGMAEVSPKFVDEAEAAVEAAASTDEALSALWSEWQRACEANDKALKDEDKAKLAKEAITDHETPEYRAATAEFEAAQERPGKTFAALMAVEDRIENMAARSVKGAATKLRVAKYWIDIEYPDEPSDEAKMPRKDRLTLSALADLERLTGQGFVAVPTIEDPVLALKREWDARYERFRSETDEADKVMNPLHDRLMEAEFAIHRTPATTPAGVAIKIWLWTCTFSPGWESPAGQDWWKIPVADMPDILDHMPIASALQDLERMSTGISPAEGADATLVITAYAEKDRITALWDAYKETGTVLVERDGEHQESGTADADDAVTEATEADSAAWKVLVSERCHTLGGILAKMSAFKGEVAEVDFQGPPEVLFDAIVRDLERMAGEGAVAPGATSPLFSRIFHMETPLTDAEGAVEALWLLVEDGKLCPDAAEPIAYLVSHLNGHIQEQRRLFDELFVAAGGSAA